MAIFHQTENFTVNAAERPHVSRTDGGHIVIRPKEQVVSRWDLGPNLAQMVKVPLGRVGTSVRYTFTLYLG